MMIETSILWEGFPIFNSAWSSASHWIHSKTRGIWIFSFHSTNYPQSTLLSWPTKSYPSYIHWLTTTPITLTRPPRCISPSSPCMSHRNCTYIISIDRIYRALCSCSSSCSTLAYSLQTCLYNNPSPIVFYHSSMWWEYPLMRVMTGACP